MNKKNKKGRKRKNKIAQGFTRWAGFSKKNKIYYKTRNKINEY